MVAITLIAKDYDCRRASYSGFFFANLKASRIWQMPLTHCPFISFHLSSLFLIMFEDSPQWVCKCYGSNSDQVFLFLINFFFVFFLCKRCQLQRLQLEKEWAKENLGHKILCCMDSKKLMWGCNINCQCKCFQAGIICRRS